MTDPAATVARKAANDRGTDLRFLLLLALVLIPFSFHLFSFTVYEGYSTLSSDSFSYLRQALAWSPWSEAEPHVLGTLPEHVRAPGVSWLLAISGGAESTYRAHLVISLLMLLSITMAGWMAYRKCGVAIGIGLTIGFCLLPGALISSLGILSENLYLLASLAALLLYTSRPAGPVGRRATFITWHGALLAFLLLAVLTRSVGIALCAALAAAAMAEAWRAGRRAGPVFMVVLGAVAGWLAWNRLAVPPGIPGEHSYFVSIFTAPGQSFSDSLLFLWQSVITNIVSLIRAWTHYLTLTNDNPLFFVGAFGLLAVVMISTAMRAMQFKADALYLCAYLAIVVLWPFPQGMLRFLHPVAMLLLLQPFLLWGRGPARAGAAARIVLPVLIIVLLVSGGLAAQIRLMQLRTFAEREYPEISHSREYYDFLDRAAAVNLPMVWQATFRKMAEAADVIPPGNTVAAVKHEAFMLLAERRAVMLTTRVAYHQQLCNFQLQDVDYVFLSPINSQLVPQPYELVEKYQSITDHIQSLDDGYGQPLAYAIKLDKQLVRAELEKAGVQCREVMLN